MKQVFGSQLIMTGFSEAKLLLPFFSSHQKGREAFSVAVKQEKAFAINKDLWLVVKQTAQSWKIENILILANLNLSEGLQQIEQAARRQFISKISLELAEEIVVTDLLQNYNYTFVNGSYQKELFDKTALVLGGGGARGAYQIGVWQALLEKRIKFDFIVGTSVGALNGALIAQGDFSAAQKLWQQISTQQVLELAFEKAEEIDYATQRKQIQQLVSASLEQRGISTAPLKELLEKFLAKGPLKCPVYVVTTKLPQFKETIVNLLDKPQQEIQWMLASSSFFPVMAITEIDGNKYIDGGYRNNLPQDVAVSLGATRLISIDVKGPGFNKRPVFSKEIVDVSLKSHWNLGDFLIFQKNTAQKNLQLGYLEAKRSLGDFKGRRYCFTLETDFVKASRDFLKKANQQLPIVSLNELQKKVSDFFGEATEIEEISLVILEYLAARLQVDPVKVYDIDTFKKAIKNQLEVGAKLNDRVRWHFGRAQRTNYFDCYQLIALMIEEL
ncbi:patatin-like phospholipase family protein [Enterococcus sp. AZ103]|uniref:patatin-like phospholipase family protein n=1 Tax=Enterococcus sp. AZ103 TaxID=2774628 RepID=UPI003F1F9C6B